MSEQEIYPITSPYHETQIVDGRFLGLMQNRKVSKKSSDVLITITSVYEFRPDLLAYDLYGDSRLWWVFAARNVNRLGEDPYFNFKTGTLIYVPTLETLQQDLGI